MTQTHTEAGELATLAETIHNARWPEGCKPTPFAEEDRQGREYCFRIARAVLAATRPATSEAVPSNSPSFDGTTYGDAFQSNCAIPATSEVVGWQRRNDKNDWCHIENISLENLEGIRRTGWEIRPLYTDPPVSPSPLAAELEAVRKALNFVSRIDHMASNHTRVAVFEDRMLLVDACKAIRAALSRSEAGAVESLEWELADCIGRYMTEPEWRKRLSFKAAEIVAKRGFGNLKFGFAPPRSPDPAVAVKALEEIESWKNDTLGKRPHEDSAVSQPLEVLEAFDRGVRMAFYRCAERARVALAQIRSEKGSG